MKKLIQFILFSLVITTLQGGEVRKTYYFGDYSLVQKGEWQLLNLKNTLPAGKTGEPMLPFCAVSLILPPGEKAVAITIEKEDAFTIPGTVRLMPKQEVRPISMGNSGFFLQNEAIYKSDISYPEQAYSHLTTSYLNGVSFALSTFTPALYNPAKQSLQYFRKVTVIITTTPDPSATVALHNTSSDPAVQNRIRYASQNGEMLSQYPETKSTSGSYRILIVTPQTFVSGFQELLDYYNAKGDVARIKTTQEINTTMTGADLQEKIRNYIIQEYQTNGIEHVLLGGDVEYVPYRGFYCYVISGSGYEDDDIPADLYYAALDGNWNTDGDNWWGEPGEDDLLPEISVARMPFGNLSEQENMIHKSISYQNTPVTGELTTPYLVGEHLYDDPMTFGQDYLELIVDDHSDNGYFTHGIPSQENTITRLYDTLSGFGGVYQWSPQVMVDEINLGHSFIHHCGHSNVDYMMRLFSWDITNANFYGVDGVTHNYPLLYSHGCLCGAFDNGDCIAEKMVTIDNFVSAAMVNSRYGWFDQGLTEGPSAHIHREFISALYNDTLALQLQEVGAAHMMSKIKSAPWVTIPNQFEPGAQRWCHYDCNVLGDPAMKIWTDEPSVSVPEPSATLKLTISPNPCSSKALLRWQGEQNEPGTLQVTSMSGNLVRTGVFNPAVAGQSGIPIDMTGMPAGIYSVSVRTQHSQWSGKLVLMH